MTRWTSLLALPALFLAACGPSGDTEPAPTATTEQVAPAAQVESAETDENQRLADFFTEIFERDVAQSPQFQAQLGRKTEDYGKWDDESEAWAVQMNEQAQADLARLRSDFDFEQLDESSRLSYLIFENNLERDLALFPWRHHRYAVSQMRNIAGSVPTFLRNVHKVDNRADAEAYIERLRGVDVLMAQYVEKLQASEAIGVVPPMMVYPRALPVAANMLTGAPFDETAEDGVLLADFRAKVDALELDDEDTAILLNEAANALSGPFRQGYNALIGELTRLQAIADDNNGVWDLPDGDAYYAAMANYWTTVDMSPDEIHEMGLAEVERIRAEMEAIKASVGFEGDLAAFFEFVRTSPENYYPNTDEGRAEYLAEATALIDHVMTIAPDYFNVLPKAPLEVRRVEPWREAGSSTAFYNRPSLDGSRPGIFYVNMQDMNAVQKHIMNSLAYHEGAPGHHFQLAIQQELTGIPEFRKFGGYSAYSEGWALYTERLAKEIGLYEDLPMRDFGRLSEEMKRAVRLVVDTGMHAKRWSREESIAYMTANTPMAPADIERQIERYFVIPGQALSYKIGMITLLELRERARQALGDDFSIAEYHDQVLKNGSMPMVVLEQVIDDWIASKQ
ncbi:DUF885 domain-containing protein [Marinihelvus fidelis]|uniref:DUF885 domain-containing protein n=1 Tax=Marinihelvus fidelis TaxID=2613842 RepID=A0A5N0THV3_9GAMM|nr:DUF885 domain-containing protein [Marinihelvus fidelis]KAA9134181.1 DUF885 domain-containing protein [Marinihelvus fidelis]